MRAATIHDPAIEKAMLDLVTPKRMVGIATLGSAASDYGAKKAILTLADFSGKKLRINGTELERQKMEARRHRRRHAAVRSRAALDQGTIDGTISGLSVFVAFKMNDLLKTITVTNDTFINSIVVVSKAWSIPCRGPAKDRRRFRRAGSGQDAGLGIPMTSTSNWSSNGRRWVAPCTSSPTTTSPR